MVIQRHSLSSVRSSSLMPSQQAMCRSINATGHDALRQSEVKCKRLSVLCACRDCDHFRVVVAVVGGVTHVMMLSGSMLGMAFA